MSDIKEQITAALKKLGPVSPGELADHLGVDNKTIGKYAKPMLEAGTLKAAGATNRRRLALPDQKIDVETPTLPKRRKKKSNGMAKRTAAKPRAPKPAPPKPAPAPDGDFIAAVTADSRLVLFIPGAARPLVFDDVQTERVAQLMHTHFEA
jgi:DNA-binding Lrp family transcriptional regulator